MVFARVAANQRFIAFVVYFHVALFGMRERGIAKQKEFDIVLYMTLE